MKNPLRKRIPRELKGEFGKYLVVFLLMVLTIGFVSGFLVADGSMLKAYNESFDYGKILSVDPNEQKEQQKIKLCLFLINLQQVYIFMISKN